MTVPLYCRLVGVSPAGVLVYATQLPRVPNRRFEVDVKLLSWQITAQPLVRQRSLLMYQLTSKN